MVGLIVGGRVIIPCDPWGVKGSDPVFGWDDVSVHGKCFLWAIIHNRMEIPLCEGVVLAMLSHRSPSQERARKSITKECGQRRGLPYGMCEKCHRERNPEISDSFT